MFDMLAEVLIVRNHFFHVDDVGFPQMLIVKNILKVNTFKTDLPSVVLVASNIATSADHMRGYSAVLFSYH